MWRYKENISRKTKLCDGTSKTFLRIVSTTNCFHAAFPGSRPACSFSVCHVILLAYNAQGGLRGLQPLCQGT